MPPSDEMITLELDEKSSILLTPFAAVSPAARPAGAMSLGKKLVVSIGDLIEPLRACCTKLSDGLKHCGPAEFTVEFEVSMTVDAGVIITNTSGSGSFKITMKWKRADETTE